MMKNMTFNSFTAVLVIMAALLSAIETLIVIGIISFYVPFKNDSALADIFFHYRKGFVPECELQLYGTGIMLAGIFFIGMLYFFGKRLSHPNFIKSLSPYIIVNAVIVMIEMGIIFKLIVTPTHSVAWGFLYGLLSFSLLIKIFWSEIKRCFGWM